MSDKVIPARDSSESWGFVCLLNTTQLQLLYNYLERRLNLIFIKYIQSNLDQNYFFSFPFVLCNVILYVNVELISSRSLDNKYIALPINITKIDRLHCY